MIFTPPLAQAVLLFALILSAFSCAGVPAMTSPDSVEDKALLERCRSPFVGSNHRFIHSIEAELPGGRVTTLMGVTVVTPSKRTLKGVLMTLEGLVIFDGEYDGQVLSITRALPPFDRSGLAEGLMMDMATLFLSPRAPLLGVAALEDGSVLCRHEIYGESRADVVVFPDGGWTIHVRNDFTGRTREVTARNVVGGVPETLELKAPGFAGYTLRMRLVEATSLSAAGSQ